MKQQLPVCSPVYATAQIIYHHGLMIKSIPTLPEFKTMKLSETIAAALLLSALMITLSACEEQGPMEEAGEEIDEGIEEAGDSIEDATD